MSTSRWVVVIGTLLLVLSLGFAFGYLTARSTASAPIVIEKNSK